MKKFKDAFTGLLLGFKDKSILTQYVLGIITIVFCVLLKVELIYFLIILLCVSLVIGFEYINTALEKVCDLYSLEKNDKIKYIKDLMAGAVLVQALFSLIIGIIIIMKGIL